MPLARPPAPGLFARALRKLGLRKAPARDKVGNRTAGDRTVGDRTAGRPAAKNRRGPVPIPAGRTFVDIAVIPGSQDQVRMTIVNGGPIWPDFASQRWPRLMRRKRAVDVEPALPLGELPRFPGPAVWGGVLFPQFGHLICEHLSRLLWSRQKWPDLPYLFIIPERLSRETLPGYVWDLLDWYGLPRAQVHLVTEPMIVPELHVMPQAERLFGQPPRPGYLRLLEQQVARHALQPVPSERLYVGRVGMIAAGSGANGGERYLQERLAAQGVALMDPTALPLREQMEWVAGAKTLIFAEGSALHGRQLLGRLDQTIHILNRRLSHDLGQAELSARSKGASFHTVTRKLVSMAHPTGRDLHAHGFSFYDLPTLFQALAAVGVDLTRGWDNMAFANSVAEDARLWLSRLQKPNPELDVAASIRKIRPEFQAEGLAHLLDEIEVPA